MICYFMKNHVRGFIIWKDNKKKKGILNSIKILLFWAPGKGINSQQKLEFTLMVCWDMSMRTKNIQEFVNIYKLIKLYQSTKTQQYYVQIFHIGAKKSNGKFQINWPNWNSSFTLMRTNMLSLCRMSYF